MTKDNALPANAPQTGTYRHYKGNSYQVLGMAQHSETDEWMVVYQALYGDYGFWVRPLSIWLEPVAEQSEKSSGKRTSTGEKDAESNPRQRFQLVTPASTALQQLTKKPLI